MSGGVTSDVIARPRCARYGRCHDLHDGPRPTGRPAAARVARAAPAQPARAVDPGRDLDAAPELRRDRPLAPDPGDDREADRAPRGATAGAQPIAAGRWVRTEVPRARR